MTPASPDEASAPRRHRLSVLFCDLSDSTALSAALEAEEYAELLAALRQAYDAAVAQHGGTVVRIVGDGLLAVFGHPLPREGDGRRAVLAALQLHEAVRGLAPPPSGNRRFKLRLHSGVHAGLVLVQGGDLVTGRFELMGMVPNIASRLSAAAGRDEILVSDETLGPARRHFRTGDPRQVRVHGHDQPVACWPIEGRVAQGSPDDSGFNAMRSTPVATAAAAGRPAAALPAFIGRRSELARLEEHLSALLAGSSAQVALAGPPGVGKTRLAAQFLLQAERRGCRVLEAYCESEFGAAPLQPVLQLLRRALGLAAGTDAPAARAALEAQLAALGLAELAPALVPVLGAAAGAATPVLDAEATSLALATLFAHWAGQVPLVLFIDDWHSADAATRQVLAAICEGARHAGLLVLYSTRGIDPGDAHMRHVLVLPLAPFTPDESALSIRALLPRADPFVAAEIYRRSGGNALFIEELCLGAAHEQVKLAGQQAGAAWLQVLIESRVARLPAPAVALVHTLAVIGNVVPEPLLQAVAGHAPGEDLLRHLRDAELLAPAGAGAGTLRFKHGLTRDVIYESVGLRERRALHARIGEVLQARAALDQEDPHEALAYHFGAAGLSADAARHAELAGDRAAALSALDRAKALYHAALGHLQADAPEGLAGPRALRWLNVSNKLGLVCVFDASRKDLPVFEQAVQLAQAQSEVTLQARAEHWLGYLFYALGQAKEAVKHCARACELAGHGDDALAVQLRATLGQAQAAAGAYAEAAPLLEGAVEVKRRHRRGHKPPVGLAYSLVCLASVVGDRGDFGRAYEHLDEALGLVAGATHEIAASIQGWRAVILGWQGRWAEALAAAQQSTRIAEQTQSLFQFCQGRATGAWAQWVQHRRADSIDRLAESTLWLAPRESGLFRSLDHGWLTEGWFERGERALARHHGALALQRARNGDLIGGALACRALARDAALWRKPARARQWLQAAQRIASQRDSRHEAACNDLCAAELALAEGDRGAALRLADQAATAFEQMQMRWHGACAAALLERL